MRKIFAPVLFVFIVAACSTAASAQWRFLGSRDVNPRLDRDTIEVSRNNGGVRSIRLTVSRTSVRFYRVIVHFRNGASQSVQVRQFIPVGGSTRTINLNFNNREIRRVTFWYESASLNNRRARVSLYGRR